LIQSFSYSIDSKCIFTSSAYLTATNCFALMSTLAAPRAFLCVVRHFNGRHFCSTHCFAHIKNICLTQFSAYLFDNFFCHFNVRHIICSTLQCFQLSNNSVRHLNVWTLKNTDVSYLSLVGRWLIWHFPTLRSVSTGC